MHLLGKIWLVMDLCKGGELNSRKINEKQVTIVAEQILRGVAYLHRRGICHRDLKMENILYENEKDNSPIRLIDFGLSKTYDSKGKKEKFMGAAYTLSPEVLSKKPYTEKSDIWSFGLVVMECATGQYPFHEHSNCIEMAQTILDADVPQLPSGQFSPELIDFCSQCLHRDPDRRLHAEMLLRSPWLAMHGITRPEVATDVVFAWIQQLTNNYK